MQEVACLPTRVVYLPKHQLGILHTGYSFEKEYLRREQCNREYRFLLELLVDAVNISSVVLFL